MHVFTTEYLEQLKARWESRPEKDWPLVVRIAMQDYRDDDRQGIEDYVGELHPEDQPKITRNLQSDKQFATTYGELLIGHLLLCAGFHPRYEPQLCSPKGVCTPDWYLDGSSPIVCDVFTAGLLQQRDADETALRDIEARLSAIKGGYVILLEVENAAAFDPRARKELAAQAERWLRSGVQKGDVMRTGSATLEVRHVGGSRVDLLTSDAMHIVPTPAKLAENFDEKAKKYAPLGFPVIAAAVKHYR